MTGTDLLKIRKALRLNQRSFAQKLDIKQAYYSEMESGKKEIGDKIIDRLIANVGVSQKWIERSEGDIFSDKSGGVNVGERVGDEIKAPSDFAEQLLNDMRTRAYEAMNKRPYKFYNSFSTKELEFELSLQIRDAKEAFNDYKLLCEALTALNPPAFLLEKFPIPESFSEYRKGVEEDFDELHSHLTDERQIKLLKIVQYQELAEHNRYLVSNLIMYIHQYSELIVAKTVRETLEGKSVLDDVYKFRKTKSFDLNIISPANKSKDSESQQ